MAVPKLDYQKELQDEIIRSKTVEIEVAYLRNVVKKLEISLKLAEGEVNNIRTKMDDYMFGSANRDQALCTIKSK